MISIDDAFVHVASELPDMSWKKWQQFQKKCHKTLLFGRKMTSVNSEVALFIGVRRIVTTSHLLQKLYSRLPWWENFLHLYGNILPNTICVCQKWVNKLAFYKSFTISAQLQHETKLLHNIHGISFFCSWDIKCILIHFGLFDPFIYSTEFTVKGWLFENSIKSDIL